MARELASVPSTRSIYYIILSFLVPMTQAQFPTSTTAGLSTATVSLGGNSATPVSSTVPVSAPPHAEPEKRPLSTSEMVGIGVGSLFAVIVVGYLFKKLFGKGGWWRNTSNADIEKEQQQPAVQQLNPQNPPPVFPPLHMQEAFFRPTNPTFVFAEQRQSRRWPENPDSVGFLPPDAAPSKMPPRVPPKPVVVYQRPLQVVQHNPNLPIRQHNFRALNNNVPSQSQNAPVQKKEIANHSRKPSIHHQKPPAHNPNPPAYTYNHPAHQHHLPPRDQTPPARHQSLPPRSLNPPPYRNGWV